MILLFCIELCGDYRCHCVYECRRQRTLTQWNMKLPDWRTDPLSITFPCHKKRSSKPPLVNKKKAENIQKKNEREDELYFKYLLNSYVVYVTIWSASKSGLDELVARGVRVTRSNA